MKIKVPTLVDIELSQESKYDITLTTLRELLEWPDGAYIHESDLVVNMTYHTSHSWTDMKVIRKATPKDMALQIIINAINLSK